jgi:LCP family protein required for cell wall assembly
VATARSDRPSTAGARRPRPDAASADAAGQAEDDAGQGRTEQDAAGRGGAGAGTGPTDHRSAGSSAAAGAASVAVEERLSPRARLARLAGGPEGAPASEADRPEAGDRGAGDGGPVDAPATTALPRPRRSLAQGGARAARGLGLPAEQQTAVADQTTVTGPNPDAETNAVAVAGARTELSARTQASTGARAPGAPAAATDRDGAAADDGAPAGDGAGGLPPELSPRWPDGEERRPRGLGRVLLIGVAAMVSSALFLVIALGYGASRYYDAKVDRTNLSAGDVEGTRPPAIAHGNEVWLLVGSDVRTGSDAAKVGGARSDTMMIAYLGSNGKTTLVSVPRDLKVTIPAYTDSKGKRHGARKDRVNTAFNLGGPALLLRTLENISDLHIDHFAEIDFNGFRQMSSVLGGVDVCLVQDSFKEYVPENHRSSTNLNDPMSGFVGKVGTNVLTGDNALAFVRQRHGFANGDYSRIQRQQAFLAAVFRKVKSTGLLTSPGRLTSFLSAVTSSMVVDSGTGLSDLKALAERMQGLNTGQVQFTTIPLSGATGGGGQAYYALYDPAMVRGYFQQIVAESDTNAAPTPSVAPSPTLAPSQVRVTILNGSRKAGAASTVASKLRAAGYQVVKVGTADSRDVERTEIRYDPAGAAASDRLLADVPGAQAVPVGTGAAGATGRAGAAAATDAAGTAGAGPAAVATAGGDGEVTLVVGQDLADGDTTVVASPTGRASATAAPQPYYTQAPVSAAGRCIK